MPTTGRGASCWTGSANLLLLPKVTESLAGRMELAQLHPLTEAEKERQPGRFVQTLVGRGFQPELRPDRQVTDHALATRLVTGGYPRVLARAPGRVRQWHRQYLREIIERDVQEVARIRDSDNLTRLLRQLAHRTAQTYNASRLGRDLELQRTTVERYLSVLERLFLVRRLPAWPPRPVPVPDQGAPSCTCSTAAWRPRWVGWPRPTGSTGVRGWGRCWNPSPCSRSSPRRSGPIPTCRSGTTVKNDRLEVDAVLTRGREVWGDRGQGVRHG